MGSVKLIIDKGEVLNVTLQVKLSCDLRRFLVSAKTFWRHHVVKVMKCVFAASVGFSLIRPWSEFPLYTRFYEYTWVFTFLMFLVLLMIPGGALALCVLHSRRHSDRTLQLVPSLEKEVPGTCVIEVQKQTTALTDPECHGVMPTLPTADPPPYALESDSEPEPLLRIPKL